MAFYSVLRTSSEVIIQLILPLLHCTLPKLCLKRDTLKLEIGQDWRFIGIGQFSSNQIQIVYEKCDARKTFPSHTFPRQTNKMQKGIVFLENNFWQNAKTRATFGQQNQFLSHAMKFARPLVSWNSILVSQKWNRPTTIPKNGTKQFNRPAKIMWKVFIFNGISLFICTINGS